MANTLIKAMFTAQETISESLSSVHGSLQTLDSQVSDLNRTFNLLKGNSDVTEEKLEGVRNASLSLSGAIRTSDEAIDQMVFTMREFKAGSISSEKAMDRLQSSLVKMSSASAATDESIDQLEDEVIKLGQAGLLSSGWARNLKEQIDNLRNSSAVSSEAVEKLNRAVTEAARKHMKASNAAGLEASALSQLGAVGQTTDIIQRRLESSAKEAGNAIGRLGRQANDTSADLGVLAAVSQATSFEFSSLSVNIGPFNVALRNIIIQLPAILTGMGALLALVTSLATAFLVLGGALGAFVGAGALVFWEDFSAQFEDTQQAVEALMGALKDLFTEAVEPLMGGANMDMFIDMINGAARVVNRFAQFFAQMRDDIMAFTSGIGGDMEAFFEALHDSFVIMTPVLQDFINFFVEGLPAMLVTFAELTKSMSGDIGTLVDVFGELFMELLGIAQVLLAAVAPVFAAVIELLSDFFSAINRLNNGVVKLAIQGLALTAVFLRVQSITKGLISVFYTLDEALLQQAASGGVLGSVYTALHASMVELILGQATLSQVVSRTKDAIWTEIGAIKAKTAATKKDSITTISGAIAHQFYTSSVWSAVAATEAFKLSVTGGLYAIVLIIAAILSAVTIYANWEGITNALAASMNFLKDSLIFLAKAIVSYLIPPLNFLMAVVKGIIGIFLAFGRGIGLVTSAMFGLSSSSEEGAGALGKLADIVFAVIDATMFLWNILAAVAKAFFSIAQSAIFAYLKGVARIITRIRKAAARMRKRVAEALNLGGAINKITDLFKEMWDVITSTDEMLGKFIKRLNKIPGVDIEGPAMDAGKVRNQMGKESEKQDEDDIQTESNVDLSFQDNLEQNVDVQADPEDKAQLSRLTKDAIEEANSFARRRQGGQ